MTQELIVVKSVDIFTSKNQVWHALTETEKIAQWMVGAHGESSWEIGSDITFTGRMPNFNKAYEDRGTVLAVERENFYSIVSGVRCRAFQMCPKIGP